MELGRGRRAFLEKGFPASPQICQAPSLKASVFIESLLPVFPGGPRPDDVVRAFFYGDVGDGIGSKRGLRWRGKGRASWRAGGYLSCLAVV